MLPSSHSVPFLSSFHRPKAKDAVGYFSFLLDACLIFKENVVFIHL